MYAGKPIIGIVGGIGSGKSFVAAEFSRQGCLVLDADAAVRRAYERPDVRREIREGWGEAAFLPDGSINRRELARRIFEEPGERQKLEAVLHPRVHQDRQETMAAHSTDPHVRAFVWDVPLLLESNLGGQCDAIVYIDSPWPERLARVTQSREWDAAELTRRENSQLPLDKKRSIAHYVIRNAAHAASIPEQVREILSRILAG